MYNFCDKLCFPPCGKDVHMKKCEKKFQNCLGRNKEFSTNENLQDHQEICFHFKKAIHCEFCDEIFASNFSCNQHAKRMHKDKPFYWKRGV